MFFGTDWNRLQQVADYRMARKTLRGGAIGSVIFGSISLGLGFLAGFDLIAVGVGAALLGTGLWNLLKPQPAGIVIDGITLLLVGALNISTAFQGAGAGMWVKLGIFQLIWGVQGIRRYQQFRGALSFVPQDTEVRQLDEVAGSLQKAKVKDSEDVIEFVTAGMHARRWRGRLTESVALLMVQGTSEIYIAGKNEFEVELNGKVMLSKDHKVKLKLKGKSYQGSFSPMSYERYQNWRTGARIPQALAA
jgi:hypothetical protein